MSSLLALLNESYGGAVVVMLVSVCLFGCLKYFFLKQPYLFDPVAFRAPKTLWSLGDWFPAHSNFTCIGKGVKM